MSYQVFNLFPPLLQVYPRDSTEPPTSDQIVRSISSMRSAALPSPNCCEQVERFAERRCPCLPAFQQVLPVRGIDPSASLPYVQGATTIATLACRVPWEPCTETPPEVPSVVATGTG